MFSKNCLKWSSQISRSFLQNSPPELPKFLRHSVNFIYLYNISPYLYLLVEECKRAYNTLHYILKCKKWVKAWSKTILGITINHIRTSNRAIENGSVRVGLSEAPGSFSAKMFSGQIERGAILESTIRLISGLGSAKKTRIVQIPQSNIYFLFICSLVQSFFNQE